MARWNPAPGLRLVSDVQPPERFGRQLDELGVQVLEAPFAHRPPPGFWPTFNASLYTIDAIRVLADAGDPDDRILLLDPDIICTGDLTVLVDQISVSSWLTYPMDYPHEEKSQGLSGFEAAELHRVLDPTLTDPPVHFGGELYGFTPESARPVLALAEEAWALALDNWSQNRPYFVTEEHLLNFALRRTDTADASPYIRRIWTTPVHRTVRGDEGDLLLWHLPAEKDRGFLALAQLAQDRESWFWRVDRAEFVRRCGAIVGIPRRRPSRWIYDVSGAAVRAVQRRWHKRRSQTSSGTSTLLREQ